jgi:protein-S-isoprenylcysteine O-methyltransferase Ste14
MKRLVRFLLGTSVLGLLLFAVAGTWRDPWLWAFLGVTALVGGSAMLIISDDLARERYRPPSPGADRLSLRTIRLISLTHLVVAVLDGTRFGWSDMTPSLRIAGLIGFGLSFAFVVRAMAANRFFSAVVRVQDDRGHHVVDRGPYARIRHPGYAGMILGVLFSAFALGSWLSLGIALVYSGLMLRRVLFEDRFLHANLDGYATYARRVPYRLIPGAW